MSNSSCVYGLPRNFNIEAKSFRAFDSPLNEEVLYFEDEDECDNVVQEEDKPNVEVIVNVQTGPLLLNLTIDLKPVTDEDLETYAESYTAFIPGKFNFEFADRNGDVWVAQCPIRAVDFYDFVFEENVSLHFWDKSRNRLEREFETGRFLRIEPWSCGHLEDEYRVKMVSIDDQEYELSTQNSYATIELSWSEERKVFIIKQIGWQTDDMEELEPIYFELGFDRLLPLQTSYRGVTFHRVKGKRGTPQSTITVEVRED